MYQNNLKTLLTNSAGLDALKDYLKQRIEETEEQFTKAAKAVVFDEGNRMSAMVIHGRLQELNDLVVLLDKLETSTEGKK